ncbi:hypothetical protein Hanom_Chr12g01068851 [Helianthus anomalus]
MYTINLITLYGLQTSTHFLFTVIFLLHSPLIFKPGYKSLSLSVHVWARMKSGPRTQTQSRTGPNRISTIHTQ